MKINSEVFGYLEDGRAVHLYTLSLTDGFEVQVMDYGGIITSIKAPDLHGNYENVVLGFDELSEYLSGHPYFGALVGRYANRIADGRFTLDGEEYQLARNDGNNHLHGGINGFDKVLWDSEITDEGHLKLSYTSVDGEEGYPGTLRVSVLFSLNDSDELKLEYHAVTDKATPVNLTSHSYFNLRGRAPTTILAHKLQLAAAHYTPVNNTLIPTGELLPTENTPFDFITSREIGERIGDVPGGYDHNYVLNKSDGADHSELSLAAIVSEPESGRKLCIQTTEPGIQFYSGNFLDGSEVSADGYPYLRYYGFCLEPQHYPDSPNHPHFPSTILRPGEEFRSVTLYSFSTL